MNKYILLRKSVFFLMLFLLSSSIADASHRKIGIGINYPGVSFKYHFSHRFCAEAKLQNEDDINILGLRSYFFFNSNKDILFFTGIELDHIGFQYEDIEGRGFAGELFLGGEYVISESLSFQMDFGPAWIHLKDDPKNDRLDPISISGVDIIVNFALNFYFGEML